MTIWWAWVSKTLEQLKIDEEHEKWFTENMLLVVYWHQRMTQTKNPRSREKYCEAWETYHYPETEIKQN